MGIFLKKSSNLTCGSILHFKNQSILQSLRVPYHSLGAFSFHCHDLIFMECRGRCLFQVLASISHSNVSPGNNAVRRAKNIVLFIQLLRQLVKRPQLFLQTSVLCFNTYQLSIPLSLGLCQRRLAGSEESVTAL